MSKKATVTEYRILKYLHSVYPEWKTSQDIAKGTNLCSRSVCLYLRKMDVEKDYSNRIIRYRCDSSGITYNVPRCKPVRIKELNMQFSSVTDCAQYLNCTKTFLCHAIRDNKTINGYHVMYSGLTA